MSIEHRGRESFSPLVAIKEVAQDIPEIKFDRSPTEIARDSEYLTEIPKIVELYKEDKLWHGTGRYKYSDTGELVDVLAGIIEKGGLVPHKDGWDRKSGTLDITSTAHSRMYARLYAAMYMPNGGRITNELGSRELWGYYYLVKVGIAAIREYGISLRQLIRGDISAAVSDPDRARKWTSKISKEKRTVKEAFLKGTDIQENYPLLLGIKKDALKVAYASDTINLHETRTKDTISLNDVSHIEVPKENLAETVEMLRTAGYSLPVIPIEYGEEYCRKFSLASLVSGRPLDESKEKIVVTMANRYEDHNFTESSDDARLIDGRPLWYVFLENPDAQTLAANDADEARGTLRQLFSEVPEIVRECKGISFDDARKILDPFLSR